MFGGGGEGERDVYGLHIVSNIFCFIETFNRSKLVLRGGDNSCCSDSLSILINHAVVLLRNIEIKLNFCTA